MLYTATHVSGHITVPDCQCTACGTRFPMPAPAAGCVERSHKRPNLWVDTRMCLLYHHLRDSGVAYDAWVSAITEHQSQHACAPSPAPWRAEPAPSPAAAPTAPTPAAHAAPSEGDGDEQAEAQHLGGDGGGCPVASEVIVIHMHRPSAADRNPDCNPSSFLTQVTPSSTHVPSPTLTATPAPSTRLWICCSLCVGSSSCTRGVLASVGCAAACHPSSP